MAEKRMKTKPLKNIGEFGKRWHDSTLSRIALQGLSSPSHCLWVIILTKRSWAIMSPENGFKFRTGHNGTQLGQWQEGVCSGTIHVWSTCEQVQAVECKRHPFQIPRLSPMSRQWPPPPGRGLHSLISIEFDNSIRLVIETNWQFLSDSSDVKFSCVLHNLSYCWFVCHVFFIK